MKHLHIILGILLACACANIPGQGENLAAGFDNPADEYRPWCYWFWINGHADRQTMDKDLESMKELGFRGLLLLDPRGYWDDDDHVKMPAPEIEFMSKEWLDNVCYAIRKADSLGLKFTMNLSNCGGSFKGPWELGEDCPKRLMYRDIPLKGDQKCEITLEDPGMPFYKDVALQAVRHNEEIASDGRWKMAGDGSYDMSASRGMKMDGATAGAMVKATQTVDVSGFVSDGKLIWDVPEGNWTLLRFGSSTIPQFSHDVDILDPGAVTRHIRRIVEPLKERVPDLFGKTLTHFYSVSWEGAVPTWSPQFEEDFLKFTGKELKPLMPMLAGFEIGENGSHEAFMKMYRKARNDMFRVNFYGTMRELSHSYGIEMYSECGGPWSRKPEVFGEADQMEFLSLNDMPQGEFWCKLPADQYNTKGISAAAHQYGQKRSSAEAFTHMTYHWSMYPDTLKMYGDQAFLDGINHFVWHTFTCSPDEFGVPGGEYFAGTHINRNVTWHGDASPFIDYLSRCQFMLQQGLPVVDIAVWAGDRAYQHWGHYRQKPYDSSSVTIPEGYGMDMMNTDVLLNRVRAEKGRLVLPDGMSYGMLVLDPESEGSMTQEVMDKIAELRNSGVKVIDRSEAIVPDVQPDFEGGFYAAHRKSGHTDIYFVVGEGQKDMIFRARGDVQLWDAVTGNRVEADAEPMPEGRTKVKINLQKRGSIFVVFNSGSQAVPANEMTAGEEITGPWNASFEYHNLGATPPAARTWTKLENLAQDSDTDISHFAGTVTLSCSFEYGAEAEGAVISLGKVIGGLAHVYLNGKDCGTVWTAPWEADVSEALQKGENNLTIRFTNTWRNMLIADCARPANERLTTSGLHYFQGGRRIVQGVGYVPTIYSGYTEEDKLQDNGVLGPVRLSFYGR